MRSSLFRACSLELRWFEDYLFQPVASLRVGGDFFKATRTIPLEAVQQVSSAQYMQKFKWIHFCFSFGSQKKKKAKKLSKVVQRGINRMGKAGKIVCRSVT